MAINTKAEKLSVLNAQVPWPQTLFEPDGSINERDKAHTLNLYSGIAIATTPPAKVCVDATYDRTDALDATYDRTDALDATYDRTDALDATWDTCS